MTTTTAAPATTASGCGTGWPGPARTRQAAVATVVVAAVVLPGVADAYTVTVAATALVFAVLAMSTQLLVGVAGLPSFGQATYLGVGAYTAAGLAHAGVTAGPVHLVAATVLGAVAAAATAPLVLRTRGTAFLMTTFAVQSLAATVAARATPVTGGDDGLHTPPVTLWPGTAPLTGAAGVYWYTLGCFLVLACGVAVLLRTRLALAWRGCADHEPRMAALGYRITPLLAAAHIAAGALAGAGGAMTVAVNRYVSPAELSFEVAALVLLAAAIGAGTMTGAVAGALAVVTVRDVVGAGTGGHSLAGLGVLFLAVAYTRPALSRCRHRYAGRPS